MSGTMILGLILIVWAIIGIISVILHDNLVGKINWFGIIFYALVPFIPFIAKILNVL